MIYDFFAKTADYVGLSGVTMLIVAYFLLNTSKMTAESMKYQLCNLIGAIFIFYSLMFHFNLSSVAIETCWILISLIGIYRVVVAKRNLKPKPKPRVDNVFNFSNAKRKLK
jgi:hypothetical protein